MAYTIPKSEIIKYSANDLDSFVATHYEYIDNLHFSINPYDCLDNADDYIQVIKQRFKEIQWLGYGDIELLWIPPFMIKNNDGMTAYFNEESKGIVVWHVKQVSDGISFLLMPQKAYNHMKFENINFRKPVIIEKLGLIYGRDAVYLNGIDFKNSKVIITGMFNGSLCKSIDKENDIPYQLTFNNVIKFSKTELDLYPNEHYVSSFEYLVNSKDIQRYKSLNNAKIKENHKHYVFHTYDDVFEIIATDFKIKLNL